MRYRDMKLFGRCVLRALLALVGGGIVGVGVAEAGCSPGDHLGMSFQFPAHASVGQNFLFEILASPAPFCSPSGGVPTGPFSFSLSPGSVVPSGTSLGLDGSVQGTVLAPGPFNFEVLVTDSNGFSGIAGPASGSIGTQTVSFTSPAPAATVGGPTYSPSASGGGSGNPVTFLIDGTSTAGTCTINAGVVSFIGAGSCIIDADQLGNANFSAAPTARQTVTVSKASQTIAFTPAPAATVGGLTYAPSATGGASGNAVTLTIDGTSTAGSCTISGGVVSFTGAGSCIIDANQAGNANYNAASQVQQTVTVSKAAQTITFTSTAPAATKGGPTYTPSATGGGSGTAVTLTIDGSSSSVCSISGGVVSFTGAGSCIIDANQAGNANYNAALQLQQTVTVGKAAQTIAFTSPAPAATVGGPTYAPSATGGGSGNAVTLTIDGSSSSVCSISGGAVSFTGAGSCIIDANQAGNANYNAASQVQQTVTVGKGAVTLALASSQNPSSFGQAVTFKVTITAGGTPTGTATFKDGATTLGTGARLRADRRPLPPPRWRSACI
jgi:hypothetical protein